MCNVKLFLLLTFQFLILVKTEQINQQGREYYNYYPPEEDKKLDYQIFQYPSNFYPMREECERNPMLPLLGKGVNFLLLKLGVFGMIKAVLALVFLGFLAKLPLIFIKLAFLKSFFLPFLVAPLFIHLFTTQMNQPSEEGVSEKPGETTPENENMMGMNEMNLGVGRQFTNNLTSVAWQSVKMFAESDQCIERISCIIGASNKDSSMGLVFSRMLKFLHYSSSPSLQERLSSIREAFNKGTATLTCSDEEYKCNNPELLVQHGVTKVKLL